MGKAIRRVRTLTLRGRKWRVRWPAAVLDKSVSPEPLLGLCHHRKRTLFIASRQSPADLADTLLHEIMHALWPRIPERRIAEAAGELLRALERLGLLQTMMEKP